MEREEWNHIVDSTRKTVTEFVQEEDSDIEAVIVHLMCNADPLTGEKLPATEFRSYVTKFIGNSNEEAMGTKNTFMWMMKLCAIAGEAEGSIFVSEVWLSQQSATMPSEDPGRVEGIIVASHHRRHGRKAYMGFIAGEGSERHISGWESDEGKGFSGKFAQIVEEKEPNQSDIIYARTLVEHFEKSMERMDMEKMDG